MNAFKKLLLAATFAASIGATAAASAVTITSTYDPADVVLSSRGTDSISFTQSIKSLVNGFVVGVDTLNSAVLSFFLKDDSTGDTETYKFILGSSSTQTETGNGLDDIPGYIDFSNFWHWTYVPSAPGSVTETVTLNGKALTDLRTDGAINITIQALSGDFIFNKSVLTADVTRGAVVPPAAVPEPATVALLGLGLLGVVASRRKSASK